MYDLLASFLRPSLLLELCCAAALLNLWRKRQEKRGRLLLLTVPFVAKLVLSVPAVGHWTAGSLEWRYPPLPARPADAEAIVVLSGDVLQPDPGRSRAELGPSTLYRCLRAAELYHEGKPCPVLLSGGRVDPHAPVACADAMADFMPRLGVPAADLIVENGSRTTYENATACAALLRERGIGRVVLVTEAAHLARALGCFRKLGVDAVPAGSGYRATGLRAEPSYWLPHPLGAFGTDVVAHEWLGIAWYWLRGRL